MATQETGTDLKPVVYNVADDASELSVTTVAPYPEKADAVNPADTLEEAGVVKEADTTEEASAEVVETPPEAEVSAKEPEEEAPKAAKVPDTVQKRIDEITKKRREAERERDTERDRRLELELELDKLRIKVPPEGKPNPEDFETEQDYLEALTDWKIDQKMSRTKESEAVTEKAKTKNTEVESVYDELNEKLDKGRDKYDDFDSVVLDEKLKLTDRMVDIIVNLDVPHEVLYYLGKNQKISAKIAEMHISKAAVELAKINLSLTAPKKLTKAPEPITPLQTTGVVEVVPERMTQKEYRAWREGSG